MIEIISNPYNGIDWANTPRVKSVSHEHAFTASMVARMYDRGIRLFGHLHYIPAVPRYPLSNYVGNYEDWCFYDVSYSTNLTYNSAASARKVTPVTSSNSGGIVTNNYRQRGLIVAYKDENNVQHYTQLIRDLNEGETWNQCCEDETAWETRTDEEDVNAHLITHTRSFSGSVPTFDSKNSVAEYTGMSSISFSGDGQTHNTDDFPQIPNAEHPLFDGIDGSHFNVMGSVASESGWSTGASNAWRSGHKLYDIDDIATIFPSSSSFYDGKLFGTVNHCTLLDIFRRLQDKYSWFKGYEIFNNGMSRSNMETFLSNYHTYLNEARAVYCLAATDWQGDFRGLSDVDGGTNVLYVPSNYDSLSVANKAKAGMDCYLGGRFVASRFGSKHITAFNVDIETGMATFQVSDSAAVLSLVFNGERVSLNNTNAISVRIPKGTRNITGEAYFADGNNQVWKSETKLADNADFLFTQAIIINYPKAKNWLGIELLDFVLNKK